MSAAKNLFAYGTLMWPEVLEQVVGRRLSGEFAVLSGYRRLRVKGESYPVIVPSAADSVEGIMYRGLNAREIRRLDLFEGKEYCRTDVWLGRKTAFTYVLAEAWRHIADHRPWHPDAFGPEQLAAFRADYRNWSELS
jgi:gamma-glutamylcyclotransferase (GGCT)/AIG2-like uncharacterized protein YtfP